MSAGPNDVPLYVQPMLSDIYYNKDLLDLSGIDTSPRAAETPTASGSLISTAASVAVAAGRRAAAATLTSQQPAAVTSPDTDGPRKEVRCVEGYEKNLYVGRSDGVVEWWVLDSTAPNSTQNGWTMRHQYTLFPRRAVSKIILLPKVSKCFVLSDGTLHALMLPSLEPLPSTTIQALRGVVNVVLNDDELEWAGPSHENKTTDMTMVVVRRKGLGIYKVGSRLVLVKEIPLPSGPISAAISSSYLCAAIPSTNTYSLIDLAEGAMTEVLPVTQIEESELDFVPNANVVVIPGEHEFLVTSFTGSSTMGVFLNGQGDPVRGTMEWEHHPLAITMDSGFILALLRNHSIVVHSLLDLDKPIQTIELDSEFSPFNLSYSPYGIAIRDMVRDNRMEMSRMLLLGPALLPETSVVARDIKSPPPLDTDDSTDSLRQTSDLASPPIEEPASGSGLTPPSSPKPFQRQPIAPTRSTSLLRASAPTSRGGPFSTAVAETLVVGPNGLQSVAPTPVILRLEDLCAEGLMDEAIALVDEERRKGRRGEIDADKSTHQGTLRYLHTYLAGHLMARGSFQKAGDYFIRAKVDPRILVRIYASLRGKLIGSAEEVEVCEGLKDVLVSMPPLADISTSIEIDLYVMEPSDHVVAQKVHRDLGDVASSSTSDVAETLRAKLELEATTMLIDFLRKTRTSRRKGGGSRGLDSRKLDMVIDTTLAKLLANAGDTGELLSLLAGSNDCVSSELEPFLHQRPYVLATVMRIQGRTDRVLELLQQIAESEKPDPLCPDPVGELAQTLGEIDDPDIILKYILWLAPRDVDKALSILMTSGKVSLKLDDAALVDELRKFSDEAAKRYLQHVVVSQKSPDKRLHQELLEYLFEEAERQVEDDGVKYHLEELDAEYRLLSDPQPYCVFLAEVAPKTPIKLVRLKLLLFLQGSPFFDLNQAADRLEKIDLLKPELAVVLGRLGKSRETLQLLARDIGDSVSAQTFCTQGGEIIPPRVARSVARHVPEMAEWAALGEIGRKRRGTVDAKTQERLVMELLGVYMRDGASTAKQTAALLNAQSVHLDVLEVLALVPPEWPLDVVSSFFKRSLRRQLHDKATGEILKAISAGQNMEVSERHLDKIAHLPPRIIRSKPSEPSPGESMLSAPDEGSIAEKEYPFDEKYSTPANALMEKQGFFDQESVNKELTKFKMEHEHVVPERNRGPL